MTTYVVEYVDDDGRVEQIESHDYHSNLILNFADDLIVRSDAIYSFFHGSAEIVPVSNFICYIQGSYERLRDYRANPRTDLMHLLGPVVKIMIAKDNVKLKEGERWLGTSGDIPTAAR